MAQKQNTDTSAVVTLAMVVAMLGVVVALVRPLYVKILFVIAQAILAGGIGYTLSKGKSGNNKGQ